MRPHLVGPVRAEPDAIARVVADTARGAGATVRLLHVAPVPEAVLDADGRILPYADHEVTRLEAEALDYLRVIEILLDGIPVELAVRFGDPAGEILAEADAFGADLIALTSARGTGLRRFLRGGDGDACLASCADGDDAAAAPRCLPPDRRPLTPGVR